MSNRKLAFVIRNRTLAVFNKRSFFVSGAKNYFATEPVEEDAAKVRRQKLLDRIIRVDHAGELGADRIYAGQLFVLGKTSVGPTIKHMWEQEREHLETFERFIPKHRVRPTALLPFWNLAGFALGASTALLGKEGAMACTVAVEEVIADHYNNQIRELLEDDPAENKEVLEAIKKFRDDEMEHHDTGLQHDALKAPFYSMMKQAIQVGCKGAIWLSERV